MSDRSRLLAALVMVSLACCGGATRGEVTITGTVTDGSGKHLKGNQLPQVLIVYTIKEGGRPQEYPMAARLTDDGEGFTFTFNKTHNPVEFRILLGADSPDMEAAHLGFILEAGDSGMIAGSRSGS